MKYFLDFDRTVYDTESFKRALRARPTLLSLMGQLVNAIRAVHKPSEGITRMSSLLTIIGTFLSHGRFMLSSEEIRAFLYPDVVPFLEAHDCTIVTYGVRAFITAKVTGVLAETRTSAIIYTSRKKGRVIRRLANEAKDDCTFVDDKEFQLESVSRWCPDVEVIEMRRDDKPGHGPWRTIHSLEEL